MGEMRSGSRHYWAEREPPVRFPRTGMAPMDRGRYRARRARPGHRPGRWAGGERLGWQRLGLGRPWRGLLGTVASAGLLVPLGGPLQFASTGVAIGFACTILLLPTIGAVLGYELSARGRAANPEKGQVHFDAEPVFKHGTSQVDGVAMTLSGRF
jgi:hypothetical protein